MRISKMIAFAALIFLSVAVVSHAVTVEAVSEKSGVYENGNFRQGQDSFRGIYHINEEEGRIRLREVISSDREGRVEEGISYEITNVMISGGLSALTVSPERKRQKIYTAVREGHLGAFEILVMGEDFYEYLNSSGAKFYLESGSLRRLR